METKVCTKCGEEKLVIDFKKSNTSKSGITSCCRPCANKIRKNWIDNNKQKEKEYNLRYRPNTIKIYKEKQQKKQEENKCLKCGRPLIGRQLLAKYCIDCKLEINKDQKKISHRKLYCNNKVKVAERFTKWKNENPERAKKIQCNYKNKSTLILNDYYIKDHLKQSGFTIEQINENPELIEIKRLIIKTKRLCKTLQN